MYRQICVFSVFTAFLMGVTPGFAESSIQELKVSRRGDVNLSCGALSHEAAVMRDVIYSTQDIQDTSQNQSRGISVAGTAASFLIGTVTGGLGIAAAGFLMDENVDDIADQAETMQDSAQQRRALMAGIYEAKGCYGPLDHAMFNPRNEDLIDINSQIEPASGENDYNPAAAKQRKLYND